MSCFVPRKLQQSFVSIRVCCPQENPSVGLDLCVEIHLGSLGVRKLCIGAGDR